MTTRQELGQAVWYDPDGTGYIMLDVTKFIETPAEMMIDNERLLPKNEFHCSLVAARKITKSPDEEARVVDTTRNFLARETIRFTGLTGERYVCRKDGEMTLIAGASVEGLDKLRTEVSALLPEYQPPFAHVTLLKSENSPFGIGINSADELAERCNRL